LLGSYSYKVADEQARGLAMEPLGFIGLGIMGRPMAKNLLKAGYPLTVYNRSRPPVEELIALGASGAGSPREVAQRSRIVITMLPDSPDVEQVVLGPGGVLEGARPGLVIVDMSTISPEVTRGIAKAAGERGVETLDAPVSGGDKGAREGTLAVMVGGRREVFERCLPVFQVLGKNIVHVGDHGAGQTVKLCNQVVCALTLQAVCEGLMLASKAGIDLEKLLQAIGGGAAASWQLLNLAPKMLRRDFEPGFKVRLMQKDLRLALSAAQGLKLPLPGTSVVHQLYSAAEAWGLGEKGTQALIAALEKMAAHEVASKG